MSKVTDAELYAVTKYYSCTIEDAEGTEYHFSLQEIYNMDTGSIDTTITWLGDAPDNVDEDEIIDACYSQIKNK